MGMFRKVLVRVIHEILVVQGSEEYDISSLLNGSSEQQIPSRSTVSSMRYIQCEREGENQPDTATLPDRPTHE
jgi:hypothetical protein